MSGTFIYLPPAGGEGASGYWEDAVATAGSLPAAGTYTGSVIFVIDTATLYYWDGAAWQGLVDGLADVSGPASSTADAIARFNGTTGKIIKNTGITIDNSDNMTGVATLSATAVTAATVRGSTSSGGDLQLSSTSNATKGNINLGTASTYDEANDRLGIGTLTPAAPINIYTESDISLPGAGLIRLENVIDSVTSEPHIEFRKSRAGGANLQNGDMVGAVDFHPRHGGTITNCAQIHCVYTGDGTTRVADLTFDTSNGSLPATRLRITGAGVVQIAILTDERLVRAGASGALETTTITIDDNGGMSFGTTTSTFRLPKLTTTQRDALTPVVGDMIFNVTLNRPQVYLDAPDLGWTSMMGWGD